MVEFEVLGGGYVIPLCTCTAVRRVALLDISHGEEREG